jgi:flagellar assembly protein FliH
MNLPSDGEGALMRRPVLAGPDNPLNAGTMALLLASDVNVSPFEFRSLAGFDMNVLEQPSESWSGMRGRSIEDWQRPSKAASGPDRGELEAVLKDAVDAARREGVLEGEKRGRNEVRDELVRDMRATVERERQNIAEAVRQFVGARERYFVEVEQEVVKLALAIAARVLHREAQMDSMLLTGAVRVVLEKMADHSGVLLRVPVTDAEAWEKALETTLASERPAVTGDARLGRGDCVLETSMGRVELGIRVQLEEIEKGFFDLLNHRPVG